MKIVKIEWIYEDIKEAELTISDGWFSCVAFCHPCKYSENDTLSKPIHASDVENLMLALDKGTSITKKHGRPFVYKIQGQIIDLDNSVIAVGDIKIELCDKIPGWAKSGDYVEFYGYLSIW